MPDDRLTQARHLKQDLLDYVLDAEGELAIALETYTAQESKRLSTSAFKGSDRTHFILDQFLTSPPSEPSPSPIASYLNAHSTLSPSEQNILTQWSRAFIGLFQIDNLQTDHLNATNWLTQKTYQLFYASNEISPTLARLKPGEMIQSRILPIAEDQWMLSGPTLHLGALGDKKLAVAIGSFRQHHPDELYADAPDLLEEAWHSVEDSHQSFSDFFGGDCVTLSGDALHRQLKAYQSWLTQRELDNSGIDGNKSLKALAEEAGISEEEMADRLSALGVDAKTSSALLEKQSLSKMVRPPLELPSHLRSAEAVTVLTDARGGQVFLADYSKLLSLLDQIDTLAPESIAPQILSFLENPDFKPFVWRSLSHTHTASLERAIQLGRSQPNWQISENLDALLLTYHDRLDPSLPETASVPMHLHDLFQRAITQLKPAKKTKKKAKSGFG